MKSCSSRKSSPRRERGQSMMEYTLVCAALALALFLPLQDDVSTEAPRSAAQLLLEGFRTAYEKFSHALSLAE